MRAFRAAFTAISTSSTPAAWRDAISSSFLFALSIPLQPEIYGVEGENIRGVDGGELFARSGLNKFIVDEKAEWLGVFQPVWSR